MTEIQDEPAEILNAKIYLLESFLDEDTIADLAYESGHISLDERIEFNRIRDKIHRKNISQIEAELSTRDND